MSDENDSSPAEPQHAPTGNSSSVRMFGLLGLLGVLLIGLAYDYLVARPAVDTAYENIDRLYVETNKDSTKMLTPVQVQAEIGHAPSKTEKDGSDLVEVYSWRSGLPIRTHNLYCVYRKQGEEYVLYRQAKFQYETTADVVRTDDSAVVNVDPDDDSISEDPAEAEAAAAMSGASSPGAGGGPGRGAGPAGGGRDFDPEEIFSQRDADGDGTLQAGEIEGRMQERLEQIDADGNGEISREEWDAFAETIRSEGGGERRSRGRPEVESSNEGDDSAVRESDSPTAADESEGDVDSESRESAEDAGVGESSSDEASASESTLE